MGTQALPEVLVGLPIQLGLGGRDGRFEREVEVGERVGHAEGGRADDGRKVHRDRFADEAFVVEPRIVEQLQGGGTADTVSEELLDFGLRKTDGLHAKRKEAAAAHGLI